MADVIAPMSNDSPSLSTRWINRGSPDSDIFDVAESFVEFHLPEPDCILRQYHVLTGDQHVSVHRTAIKIFDAAGIIDPTFGYNLAWLNFDSRYPNAGFRYAESEGDETRLYVSFTPTTHFCPVSDTLALGVSRAWNNSSAHDYAHVIVRVARMHQLSDEINRTLAELEEDRRVPPE